MVTGQDAGCSQPRVVLPEQPSDPFFGCPNTLLYIPLLFTSTRVDLCCLQPMTLVEQQMLEFLNQKFKFYTFMAMVEYLMSYRRSFVLLKSKLVIRNQYEILSSTLPKPLKARYLAVRPPKKTILFYVP